jgi:hypothetical protein
MSDPPDLTAFVLSILDTQANGGNWDASSAGHPIRYNREDGKRLDTGNRTQGVDFTEGNVVSVRTVNRDRTPVGTEFDYRFVATLSVRLEGVHTDERGGIDPTGSNGVPWQDLTRELEAALDRDRTFPTSDANVLSMVTSLDRDFSGDLKDNYRADYTVEIRGYEIAP